MTVRSYMAQATDTLRRLLADEGGEPTEAALEDRLVELDEVEERADTHTASDVELLSTLAGRTRYRLVRVLVEADEELAVCELDAVMGVSQSAVSHALADLASAGLVEGRDEGRWRYYRPTERAEQLLDALDETR